jgi:hypothetical protein
MGLETDISKLYAKGLRPAILGAVAFLFIATLCLLLIKLTGKFNVTIEQSARPSAECLATAT